MPVQTTRQPTESIEELDTETANIDYIGIEFEYPVAVNPDRVPVSPAQTSGGLRSASRDRRREEGLGSRGWEPGGYMGSDHTGAEITSEPMQLHSTEPEIWYARSIEIAEELGYPFAAVGSHDSTNFGLHLNLSPVTEEQQEFLYQIMSEPWFDAFIGASVTYEGADPWRHGGGHSARTQRDSEIRYNEDVGDYIEWRLPEPGLPNHVSAVFHFLRVLDTEGPEAAHDYAHDMVWDRSELLTSVQQYNILREEDGWLEQAFTNGHRNDEERAEAMGRIMGDL